MKFLISFGINLAMLSIWYLTEYMQFGELQLNRACDNIVWMLYMFIIWIALEWNGEDER